MKIALIVYACFAAIWFIAQVYSSYKDKYKFERQTQLGIIKGKCEIRWLSIIFGAIFWPIDMLICLIKIVAMKNSR